MCVLEKKNYFQHDRFDKRTGRVMLKLGIFENARLGYTFFTRVLPPRL